MSFGAQQITFIQKCYLKIIKSIIWLFLANFCRKWLNLGHFDAQKIRLAFSAQFMHSKKFESLYPLISISENHDIRKLKILQRWRLQVLTIDANNGHEFQISKTSSKYKSAPSKSKSSRWRQSGILVLLLIWIWLVGLN